MPRKGENIYKRRDGRWEGRYQAGRKPDGSVKYRSVYAKTYREVKELLIQRKSQQYHDPPKCVLFVKDLMAIWLNLRAIEVKESTYNQYETIIRSHIVPFFDGMRISSLTPEIIADFIRTLQKNGRTDKDGGLSEQTVDLITRIFRSAIKLAQKRYGLNLDYLLDVRAPATKMNHVEIFGASECQTIANSVLSSPDLVGCGFLLALSFGLRIGEVCGLKWSDIDYVELTMTINRTVMRLNKGGHSQLVVQTPKTDNSNRTVPITPDMAELLSNLQKDTSSDAFILSASTTKPYDPRNLQKRFEVFQKRHGIPHHSFHTLRHTFATRVIEQGYDPKAVSEILGHKDVKTTLALYVHPSMKHKREIVDAASLFPEK